MKKHTTCECGKIVLSRLMKQHVCGAIQKKKENDAARLKMYRETV